MRHSCYNICKIRQNLDVSISDSSMTLCGANIVEVASGRFVKVRNCQLNLALTLDGTKLRLLEVGKRDERDSRVENWAIRVLCRFFFLCAQITGSVWISVTHKNTGFVYYLSPFVVRRYNITGWISALGNISAVWSTNPNNFTAKHLFQVFSSV